MKTVLFTLAAVVLLAGGCAHSPSFTSPKLDILNQQVQANTNNAQAYSNRGYTLAILGQKEVARADLRRALALKSTAPLHNSAGFAYFNLGDYADALREWRTAADMSQRRGHYDYYSLALGYWGVGDLRQALENYQLAVEREPKFGDVKLLAERTAEWTPRERDAIQRIYTLWSKAWRP